MTPTRKRSTISQINRSNRFIINIKHRQRLNHRSPCLVMSFSFYVLKKNKHSALEGGILQHGLKRFTTIEGHKEESCINGVWMLPGSHIKPGIQYVCKNDNNDLIYSDNKVGLVICQKDESELKKKLHPFPLCYHWARSIHPSYSIENMNVNAEFIFIVNTQNIPQFFDDNI